MTEGEIVGLRGAALAKLILAVAGIAVFGLGIRYDSVGTRWAGIGLVAVAWVMRFVKSPAGEKAEPE